jgi:hypothetical protein
MTPPAKLHVAEVTQLVAPPSRLRQQTLPPVQAEPSRHPMFAPPMHVAPALMHIAPACVTQQDCDPGTQVV